MNRETKVIEKHSFVIENRPNFFVWLRQRTGKQLNDLMKLSEEHREKLLLKWKWGFEDENANRSLEMSRHWILRATEGMEFKEEGYGLYFDCMYKFEKKCMEIKEMIGLIKLPQEFTSPLVNELLNSFDGEIQ